MAYLFDDASNNRITKTTIPAWYTVSLWFYPDDSAADCTLLSQHNGAGSTYQRLLIQGSVDDKVHFQSKKTLGIPVEVVSTGTVNYNSWNHVVAFRGVASPTHAYISLNGETLVDGGAGSYDAPNTMTGTALGVTGVTTRTNYMSGRIAEVALWDNSLQEFGDGRYEPLFLGVEPLRIPVGGDPGLGLGPLSLISYSPLIGTFSDWVAGDSWATVSSPTVAEHCRVFRNLSE